MGRLITKKEAQDGEDFYNLILFIGRFKLQMQLFG